MGDLENIKKFIENADGSQDETKSSPEEKNSSEVGGESCDVEGSVENSSELENQAEVEMLENSNDSEIQEKQAESKSNIRREGSGDKETTSKETSESESNQGPCNKENSKKDDTLTTETMSDTEGGFIVEVNVPKNIDYIELEEAQIFCSF